MDLLFRRYANPYSLIDMMILSCRFCEFVDKLVEYKINDERWEYWLHRFIDIPWEQFKYDSAARNNPVKKNIDFETTVKDSMEILNNFVMEE